MPKADNKEWPREDVERLHILAKMGMTTRLIGERLGYSKNAVCGKLKREKITIAKRRRLGSCRGPALIKDIVLSQNLPPKEPMGDGCLWPMGDKWCGCERASGEPYCPEHVRVAWTGVKAMPIEEAIKYFTVD